VPRTYGGAMAIEQTLILAKADAVARGLTGEILARFERRGYTIAAMKLMIVDEARAKTHYAEHEGKPFFKGLVEYITSAPLVALVIEGSDAIEGCRTTIGATNPIKSAPGSIRGDYGQTIGRNLVHGSDSAESAKREIAIWFDASEIYSRKADQEKWLVEV
jgi:nucleoside-diphosphate kinase